jgi:hypothetical protein
VIQRGVHGLPDDRDAASESESLVPVTCPSRARHVPVTCPSRAGQMDPRVYPCSKTPIVNRRRFNSDGQKPVVKLRWSKTGGKTPMVKNRW